MILDDISRQARRLKQKYHETDPFKICEAMNILVSFEPMGAYEGACKGFFIVQSRKRLIMINEDLTLAMQRVIAAHELGHASLHRKALGINTFHDFDLLGKPSQMECEANMFAAEFLISDQDVLERMEQDSTFFNIAAQLEVPLELLDYKTKMMKLRGHTFAEFPIQANSRFLGKVKVDADRIGCY